MQNKAHWENVYHTRQTDQVSWFQEHAERSLQFIHNTGVAKDGHIMDVGGGASTLVDDLLREGYRTSPCWIFQQQRWKPPKFVSEDIRVLAAKRQKYTGWKPTSRKSNSPKPAWTYGTTRAVFHFLTDQRDRQRYVQAVLHAVKPGGHVIVFKQAFVGRAPPDIITSTAGRARPT